MCGNLRVKSVKVIAIYFVMKQFGYPAIGVPSLANDCASKIAKLKGTSRSEVLAAIRANVRQLYKIQV